MGQRDDAYRLENELEFDNAFFGGPTVGKKRGRGTEKPKVFVALSLDEKGHPNFLKMKKAKDVRKKTVQTFAENFFTKDAVIYTDGLQSFVSALGHFNHRPRLYDPNSGPLRWLHIVISNAKAFNPGHLSRVAFQVSGFVSQRILLPLLSPRLWSHTLRPSLRCPCYLQCGTKGITI